MKYLLIILVCFFTISVFTQTTSARGFVLDQNTKAPISYVNISILKSQTGTSSYNDGSFSLEILKEDLSKKIKLSSLGYYDSILTIKKFLKEKRIFLKPKIEELEEVVIIKKFEERFFTINPIRRKDIKSGFMTGSNPWKIALFFPYKDGYESTEYLKTVKIYLKHSIYFKSHPSKFRIRLFSINEDGLPGNDLVSESIVIETKKRQKEVEIDISKFNLTFPEKGFFIAIEWLHIPFNEYEMTYTQKGKKGKQKTKRYAPTFSATNGDISINKIAIFSSGQWFKGDFFKDPENQFMIPAISVTLSN